MLLSLLLYGNLAASVLFAVFFLLILKEKNLPFWEKLPRERYSGALLGFAALLAFIPNVEPMFPVERHLGLLIVLAVVLTVLCFFYIDHIFARALAGALILCAHASLEEAYAADLRFYSFFAVMSLVMGTAGIFLAAKPYYLRDLFRKCASAAVWKYSASAVLTAWALSSFLLILQLKK